MANVVITGCNSGFGRLTTETLAKAGHTIFATMRGTAGKNAKAAAELKAFGAANGNRVHVVDLDVTSDSSVKQAFDAIAKQSGGIIDVLFNNAGIFSGGVEEAYTLEEIKSVFEVNVFGPLRVNRATLPYMRKRRSGLVIAISSIVGRFPLPCVGPYSASKFALEALAEAQADELRPLGIDVVVIEAGAFPTEVNNKGLYAADAALASEYGAVAGIPQKIGECLGQRFASPSAPNPQDVPDAVKMLIDTPAGQRPTRLVVDPVTGNSLRALNEVHNIQRRIVLTSFGVG